MHGVRHPRPTKETARRPSWRPKAPLVLLVLLAGCASDPVPDGSPAETPDPAGAPAADDAPVPPTNATAPGVDADRMVAQGTGCEQLHAIFASPRGGADWGLPEGWSTSDADPAGASEAVFVYPTVCDTGSEAWVLVGVEPPEALRDTTVDLEYWTVRAIVSDPAVATRLRAAGFPVAEGTASLEQRGNAEAWLVESGDGGRYTLASAVGSPTGDDFLVVQRFWAMGDDGPVALRVAIPVAEDRGVGSVVFASEGDAGAPPALPGIAHRIGGMSYHAYWDDDGSDADSDADSSADSSADSGGGSGSDAGRDAEDRR